MRLQGGKLYSFGKRYISMTRKTKQHNPNHPKKQKKKKKKQKKKKNTQATGEWKNQT